MMEINSYTLCPVKHKNTKPHAVTIRFSDEELNRIENALQRVQERNPLATRNDLLRELLGFTSYSLLTNEEREALSREYDKSMAGGSKTPAIPPQAQRQQNVSHPHLSEPMQDSPVVKSKKHKEEMIQRDIDTATEEVLRHARGKQ